MPGERIARELRLDLGLIEDRYRNDIGELLVRTLGHTAGSGRGAARVLGITHPTVRAWMSLCGVDPRREAQKKAG